MTSDQRRLGMGMMLGAAGVLVLAYLVSGYSGWVAWVLVAIALSTSFAACLGS